MKLVESGKKDENLVFLQGAAKEVVAILAKALDKLEDSLDFEMFTFDGVKAEERKGFIDIITTAVAIEIKEQIPKTLETLTYDYRVKQSDEDPDGFSLILTVKNAIPDYSNVNADDDIEVGALGNDVPGVPDLPAISEEAEGPDES
jgi:hypothetical protein